MNALTDPGLTSIDSTTGFPTCYQPGGWGTNTVAWANTTNVPPGSPAGSKSEDVTITNYSSGDAKLLPTLDQGACTPTVVPGDTYNLSVEYESTAVSQFALYYRTTFGNWVYWTSSPWFAASSTWAQATFTTPAVPSGANGVSFGLALIANGSLTTNDYSFVLPASGGAAAPALKAGPASGTATGPITPITKELKNVHSHLKLQIPGKGSVSSGRSFPVPEWPGPHAKSPT